ncbi:CaiB/BaiF CoA transferase family protein [Actinomadura sp. SCN-SB]|uniref:CaiB/BaiF CoA transferase family protein n=1 Tax=Actinomadura sp. SCN-SB TaxID=3373092 RepID=UPI0037525BC5
MAEETPGALAQLRVVELGRDVAVPYAARLLADLGADVVKVEDPEGDPLRAAGPFHPDDRERRYGGLFEYVNANKRGVTVDLQADSEAVRRLVRGCDILIENLGPGRLEAIGLAPGDLRESHPGLSVVRVSDFGQDGPYRDRPATPFTLQAAAGVVAPRGGPEPVQVGGRYLELVAGGYIAAAALTAYHGARRNGRGQDVDVSMMECAHSILTFPTITNAVLKRLGRKPLSAESVLLGVRRCRDGWVGVNILTGQQWQDVCELVGAPEYAERREDLRQGGPDRDDFERRVEAWLSDLSVIDVVTVCQALRIPAVPVHDGASIVDAEHWREREFFVREERGGRPFVRPSFPWRLEATPARSRRPAPAKGEHNAELLGDLDAHDRVASEAPASGNDLPLAGVRVLDLGTFWAGGAHGTYLGAMGADVIKVESVQRPDGFRYNMTAPQLGERWYEGGRHRPVNLNKRGLTLDLSRPEGREPLERLIASADVIAENYAARVMDHLGLGWERVREINPGIIMVRMPGYGLEGPWRDFVGWGNPFEQVSGQAALTGPAGGPPTSPGGYTDPAVALHAVVATLAALRHRERTGQGQLIEVPQIEVGACVGADPVIEYALTGHAPGRNGNRSSVFAPQGAYVGSDGRRVALSVRDDADWKRLRTALGDPDWARDPALETVAGRHERHDALDAALGAWASEAPAEKLAGLLLEHGVPAAVVTTADDFHTDPQLTARGYYQELPHPVMGPELYPGWPMRFSHVPDQPHRAPAPLLGEHNEEILRGELGLTAGELRRLEEDRVIGTVPLGL